MEALDYVIIAIIIVVLGIISNATMFLGSKNGLAMLLRLIHRSLVYMFLPLLRYDMGTKFYTPKRALAGFALFAIFLQLQLMLSRYSAGEEMPFVTAKIYLSIIITYIVIVIAHFVYMLNRSMDRIYSGYIGTPIICLVLNINPTQARRWLEPILLLGVVFILSKTNIIGGWVFFAITLFSVIQLVYVEWRLHYLEWHIAKQPVDASYMGEVILDWSGDKNIGGSKEEEFKKQSQETGTTAGRI